MKQITLHSKDNYPIVAHLFSPQIPNGKLLLINSATGVKQQMYFSFAQFFSSQGYTVITYDYRGIGLSKPEKIKKFFANMRIWGEIDFSTITNWIEQSFPNFQKYCLGHSVGALVLGMNPQSNIFSKFIFLATQKAYFQNLTWKVKIMALFGFGIAQPITTLLFQYFPAHYFGLGESLPSGCAFDWRSLILNKESTNFLLKKTLDVSKKLKQPTLFLYAEDDNWVTPKGMNTLIVETYTNLKVLFKELKTEDSPNNKIGHINFFRSYNNPLWQIPLDWLEK